MLKYRAVSIFMSLLVLTVAITAENSVTRKKRQAPNINVHEIPKTSFSCEDKKVGEYYADPETNCQVYHVCIPGMHNRLSLISFVCPNGTIFSQATRVCTPYERVDCRLTSQFYENVLGVANSRRSEYDSEDYDNYVPPPPPRPQPPRQSAPSRSRNTPTTPPPPPTTTQQSRGNRFRSNQFRGQQAPPATTRAPLRVASSVQPSLAIPMPARPAFRPPVLAARPAQAGAVLTNNLPARPTARAVVSTSTSSYNYEYEYEYDYEDEAGADQANARSKRETSDYIISPESFTCEDKVIGAAYADVESNCEMFHICILLGKNKVLDYKVSCAKGTAFDQEKGSCQEKEEVACKNAHLFFQFQKMNEQMSIKKPVISKKKYSTSKKATRLNKE